MNIDSIKIEAYRMLTDKRKKHTEGVVETALKLAEIYGENYEKVEISSICHDIFRGVYGEELNKLIAEYGLDPERYMNNANLAHGKLAAEYMKRIFDITDQDVIDAVSYHTTGRANMSLLEKIVFIADAIEPGRDYPGVKDIREMAFKDIDKACLMSLEGTKDHLLQAGMKPDEIDIDTLNAIEYFNNL